MSDKPMHAGLAAAEAELQAEIEKRVTPPSLAELSDAATPGPWSADPKRLYVQGQPGPVMSYLYGNKASPEGMKVSLGSERHADHHFVAALVNAFRAGELVARSEKGRSVDLLKELLRGAVMSKFATQAECTAYRGAIIDCIAALKEAQ